MAKTKIEVERVWDSHDVRNLCINGGYYTCGTNEEYGKMLQFVQNHKPTKDNIFRVAEDIYKHSGIDLDTYGVSEDEMIAGLMFEISRKCVTEHFAINREA